MNIFQTTDNSIVLHGQSYYTTSNHCEFNLFLIKEKIQVVDADINFFNKNLQNKSSSTMMIDKNKTEWDLFAKITQCLMTCCSLLHYQILIKFFFEMNRDCAVKYFTKKDKSIIHLSNLNAYNRIMMMRDKLFFRKFAIAQSIFVTLLAIFECLSAWSCINKTDRNSDILSTRECG